MTWAMLLTLLVICSVLALMMADVASPDLLLLGGVLLLTVAGVITTQQAFIGFGNTGMLTVAALFVVGAGLRETGAVQLLTSRLLGLPRSERTAIARLVFPVAAASAFLNNTTIVATLLPAVNDWSRRIGIAPGRLLMPLSFAAILGGTCTLIGTSTNLVVQGLVTDMAPTHPGLHPLSMFEISPVGVVVALAGSLFMVFAASALLPDRRPPLRDTDDVRQYTVEVLVPAGSRWIGRTAAEAGLRHLPGAYFTQVIRGDEVIAVTESVVHLHEGDRLIFVGDIDATVELQRFPGLAVAPTQVNKLGSARQDRQIVEAVVSPRNRLVGRTIKDVAFRKQYQAVVLAVARSGERLSGPIRDIVLHAGDTLLLEADADFVQRHRFRTDFNLVSSVVGATPPRYERAPVAILILLVLVVVSTAELMSTVQAAFLGAGAMVVTRCCTMAEARRALDMTVLVAIAAAFGLGEAMEATGLDKAVAELVFSAGATHPLAALIAVYVATMLLTELVTNNAAAVLATPLAVALAERLEVSPMGFVVAVMFAASASFMTPIGYQTNLMVFNAGGYRPLDYIRLGLPLSITAGVVTVSMIPLFWPF